MSQKDFQSIEIEGCKYEVYMLPALASNRLFISFSKMIGPVLGELAQSLGADTKKTEDIFNTTIDLSVLTKILQAVFANVEFETLSEIIKEFSKKTIVNGQNLEPQLDFHFRGRLDLMYRWLAFAIKVQWGNSISALWNWNNPQSAEKM